MTTNESSKFDAEHLKLKHIGIIEKKGILTSFEAISILNDPIAQRILEYLSAEHNAKGAKIIQELELDRDLAIHTLQNLKRTNFVIETPWADGGIWQVNRRYIEIAIQAIGLLHSYRNTIK